MAHEDPQILAAKFEQLLVQYWGDILARLPEDDLDYRLAIGKRVQTYRGTRKVEELLDSVHNRMSPSLWRQIEHGEVEATATQLRLIAVALGVHSTLLRGDVSHEEYLEGARSMEIRVIARAHPVPWRVVDELLDAAHTPSYRMSPVTEEMVFALWTIRDESSYQQYVNQRHSLGTQLSLAL